MSSVPSVDRVEDLWVELDVGVVLLPARWLIRSKIDLAWVMDNNEEDSYMITHGLEVLNDAAREYRSVAQVIDVLFGYLAVSLQLAPLNRGSTRGRP